MGSEMCIRDSYESWESIQQNGLDALIISGANVTHANLSEEIFWDPLIKVIDWAEQNVTSTLCSCLTTHAVLQFRYGTQRRSLNQKMWGVFPHRVCDGEHPLVSDINTEFNVPHSRFNEVSPAQFRDVGLHVLVEGDVPGVQLAVSPDGFRMVFFQGHPEYDRISLMKEYKREVGRYINRHRETFPPFPENYFDSHCCALLDEYRVKVDEALNNNQPVPLFPEEYLVGRLQNTWHDSGEAIVGNWVGAVYQLTHTERRKPYMDGINVDDPLAWLGSRSQ